MTPPVIPGHTYYVERARFDREQLRTFAEIVGSDGELYSVPMKAKETVREGLGVTLEQGINGLEGVTAASGTRPLRHMRKSGPRAEIRQVKADTFTEPQPPAKPPEEVPPLVGFGWMLIIIGVILALYGMLSSPALEGAQVVNLDKQNTKTLQVIAGVGCGIIGAIFVTTGGRKS